MRKILFVLMALCLFSCDRNGLNNHLVKDAKGNVYFLRSISGNGCHVYKCDSLAADSLKF